MIRSWTTLTLLFCASTLAVAGTVTVIDTRSREYPLPSGSVRPAFTAGFPQRLPLQVTVSVQDPSKVDFGQAFEFEVRVRNASKHNISLPTVPWDDVADKASKDSVCVMTGILLSLFNDTKQAEKTFITIFLFGSPEVSGTTVLLKPGDRLRILGKVAKVEVSAPFIKGRIYATLLSQRVWLTPPSGERCSHEKKPVGIVESAPGPEVDLRHLPPSQ